MLKLAAFADEISPDLGQQIAHCRANGVTHIELRGVAGKNVLAFDPLLRSEIKQRLADNGLAVACIGSPIGKVKIAEPWEPHFEKFKIAVELAEYFDAPLIRVFSYYESKRAEVLRRFEQKLNYLAPYRPILVHENEGKIYGERAAQCRDLLQTFNSPRLRAAFDFANFIQAGEDPRANWPLLKEFTAHIHIKDAVAGTGEIVPAGQGAGHIGEILHDAVASGYRGFVSLEPHLKAAGQFSGFTGPDLFKVAVDALRQVCRQHDVPLAS